ncbi:MAG: acyltransferase [Rickettsiales bacterium]|nr:acyltransferase [Rickettsiales bacterium]
MGRRFAGVRLLRAGARPQLSDGPVLVVMNHPSWWDPLFGSLLSDVLGRCDFAPMDAAQLERYGFFKRLGFFGIQRDSHVRLADFLRTVDRLLQVPEVALWITAQGRFSDVRQRPARLEGGVGHVARRMKSGSVLPLAIEYGFWDESKPEAFAAFGEPLAVEAKGHTARQWTELVEHALEQTQDHLAAAVQARDAERFETMLSGRVGVGGIYDLQRALRARLRGERFRAAHSLPEPLE